MKKRVLYGGALIIIVSLFLVLGHQSVEAQTSSILPNAPGSFAALVKKAKDSVVNISTVKIVKGHRGIPFPFETPFGQNDPFKDFFRRFFGDQLPKEFRQRSLGSGFIIDKEGYILTNNHVVEGTEEIKVKLSDDTEIDAKIVGRDPKSDLALLRIKTDHPLKPLLLGDSDKIEVGDWVVAIGNPFGLGNTVTAGIVSAKYRHIGARSYDNFIQTDAPINPGNSGGPLLNTAGEVIGINTAIYTQSGGSIGIGFAIPINIAKKLLPQLKKGKVERGWLGVMIQKITPELKEKLHLKTEHGALVADVTPGGPAAKAGIRRGDVIVKYDGKPIREMNDLPYLVGTTPVGKVVEIEVIRDGRTKVFEVKIGRMEGEQVAAATAEPRPHLGMAVEELTPQLARQFGLKEKSGLVVVDVESGSAAEDAGIQPGDLILEIDQKPVKDLESFNKRMSKYKKGDVILLLVKRRGSTLFLTLKVWE